MVFATVCCILWCAQFFQNIYLNINHSDFCLFVNVYFSHQSVNFCGIVTFSHVLLRKCLVLMRFQFRKILYTSSKFFPQNHFKITFFKTAENSINGFKVFSFKISTGVYETLFTLHPPSDLKCLWFELEIDGSLDAFAELSKGAAGVNFLFVSVPMS